MQLKMPVNIFIGIIFSFFSWGKGPFWKYYLALPFGNWDRVAMREQYIQTAQFVHGFSLSNLHTLRLLRLVLNGFISQGIHNHSQPITCNKAHLKAKSLSHWIRDLDFSKLKVCSCQNLEVNTVRNSEIILFL